MNYFWFYLIGFVIVYLFDKFHIPANTWRAVLVRLYVSLLSWLTILLFITTSLVDKLGEELDERTSKKPYKWL